MIKNYKLFEKFEKEFKKKEKLTIEEKYEIYNAMYEEAVELGIFPLKNPLEGIEVDIKIAKFFRDLSKYEK